MIYIYYTNVIQKQSLLELETLESIIFGKQPQKGIGESKYWWHPILNRKRVYIEAVSYFLNILLYDLKHSVQYIPTSKIIT